MKHVTVLATGRVWRSAWYDVLELLKKASRRFNKGDPYSRSGVAFNFALSSAHGGSVKK